MARDFFKPLSEYLKSSQREWKAAFTKDTDPELLKQADYEEGVKYIEQGRYEDAIPYLKKAITSKQHKKDAYYLLAACYRKQNLIPLARKMYERVMRLDYNYRDVQAKIRELDSPGRSVSALQPSGSTQTPPLAGRTTTSAVAEGDRYHLLDTIHESPFSRIYRVQDTLLGRSLALKHVDHHYPHRTAYFQQMRERTALDHPNILRIYDIDATHGHIAMEYVEGWNFRQVLQRRGAFTPKMLLYIAIQLVNGLHHAHTHGIVHDALTPEHILLTRQCALKIIAFRALDAFMRLQKTGKPYKYPYIPPELFRRKALTVVSNVYSFGVILYEMFTGTPPFTISQIKTSIEDLSVLCYDEALLSPGMRPIVGRCLAIAPEHRYPTMREVGEDLVGWYKQREQSVAHNEDVTTYKDYLLIAWADGKITEEEANFLAHKRQELHIAKVEAEQAETEVKQELKRLFQI